MVARLPTLQRGWTSLPQADSTSHGLAFHHYSVSTHPVLAHAASPRRSIHSKSKSPRWSHLQNTCRRQSRGHCDCALPGATRLVEEGFTRSSACYHLWLAANPSAEAGADLQFWFTSYTYCGLDGACPRLFWAAQSLFIQDKTLVASKPEATPCTLADLAV